MGEDRIKIRLSKAERTACSLDGEGEESGGTKKALRKLLEEAGRQAGFSLSDGELFVQVFSEVGGGCEIYATRLPAQGTWETAGENFREDAREESREKAREESCEDAREESHGETEKVAGKENGDAREDSGEEFSGEAGGGPRKDAGEKHFGGLWKKPGEEKGEALPEAPGEAFSFDAFSDLLRLCERLTDEGYREEAAVLFRRGKWFLRFPPGQTPFYTVDYGRRLGDTEEAALAEYGRILYRREDLCRLALLGALEKESEKPEGKQE